MVLVSKLQEMPSGSQSKHARDINRSMCVCVCDIGRLHTHMLSAAKTWADRDDLRAPPQKYTLCA